MFSRDSALHTVVEPSGKRQREVEPGTAASPPLRQVDGADAERALVQVVDNDAVTALVAPAVAAVHAALAGHHVVLVAPFDAVGLAVARPGSGHELVGERRQCVGDRQRRRTTDERSTRQSERLGGRPAVRPVGAGDREPQAMTGDERPRGRLEPDAHVEPLAGHQRDRFDARVRRRSPTASTPSWVRSSMPRVISVEVPSGATSHSFTET